MYPYPGPSLTIGKVLNGISKSLYIIKTFSPLYKDLTPLIRKIPDVYNRINNVRTNISTFSSEVKKKDGNPTFFH